MAPLMSEWPESVLVNSSLLDLVFYQDRPPSGSRDPGIHSVGMHVVGRYVVLYNFVHLLSVCAVLRGLDGVCCCGINRITQDLEQGWRGIYAPEPEDGEQPDSWKDMSIASGGCPVIWRVDAEGATLGPPMMSKSACEETN
eukprot:COSAG06_NODE_496_length_15043_cov_8.883565_2_plen_141_part_00